MNPLTPYSTDPIYLQQDTTSWSLRSNGPCIDMRCFTEPLWGQPRNSRSIQSSYLSVGCLGGISLSLGKSKGSSSHCYPITSDHRCSS